MQQVLVDSTETLVIYPPAQWLYQASAADVRIGTSSVAMPDVGSEEAATVDSVDVLVNATANAGTDSLTLASDPSAVVGRKYLVETPTGERFTVRVSQSGTTVFLSDPLPRDVPSGSSFKGIAITHALTSTETDEVGDGLVKVRATLNGVQRAFDVSFRVVRAIFPLILTTDELTRAYPQTLRLRASSDKDLTEAIEAAWEYVLRPELRARGYFEERINNPSELVPAHALAVVYMLTQAARPDDIERIAEARKDFRFMLDSVLASSASWYSLAADSEENATKGGAIIDEMVAWVTR